ncbi:uncharacterized transporter slc-17.2-like [Mercenaria mercenaria]|uniref:uncharacterized transporter slc-17.2-like n=1 Tax=Mercenaria mercenaria TaxID=6596 RepID=UPI00234F92CB|nr:uncharacterized transporter slc-17.2-like [Mercenaria mercenaria]
MQERDNYTVKAVKEHIDGNVPGCCSQRWILAYIGFFGFAVFNSLRVNLSVAVVCMVKTPQIDFEAIKGMNVCCLTVYCLKNFTNTSVLPKGFDLNCIKEEEEASHSSDRAELEWDVSTKELILASFYYGYIITQIPGGWLAHRFGGKKVLFTSIFGSSLLTLFLPLCARTHVYLLFALRVGIGLFSAMTFPAMHDMWGQWAPPLERSKLTALCYAGATFGNVLTFSTSGVLCAYGFDGGWGSIFYVTGSAGVLWTIAWLLLSADNPSSHPRITTAEKNYITESISHGKKKTYTKVPWVALAKSPCLFACLTAHVCNNWTNATLLTNIPTFMMDVLHFDIKSNGVLSAVPYICQFLSGIFSGQFADFLRSRKYLSTTTTRKCFQTCSFMGAAVCLVGTGFCSCEHRTLAVILLSLAMTFMGLGRAGYMVNHVDIAPAYAGVLFGITNTSAALTGMTAPLLVGYLTPNATALEWRNVFYVCAGFDVFGTIVFSIFASGELQEWAIIRDNVKLEACTNGVDQTTRSPSNLDNTEADEPQEKGQINYGYEKFKGLHCRL